MRLHDVILTDDRINAAFGAVYQILRGIYPDNSTKSVTLRVDELLCDTA